MDKLNEFISKAVVDKKYVSDCPPTSYVKYRANAGEHTSVAITVAHSGLKPEGYFFPWYAETAELAVQEFARVISEFVRSRPWGYRRHPEVAKKEWGYVCSARVFVFDKAACSAEVKIIEDER